MSAEAPPAGRPAPLTVTQRRDDETEAAVWEVDEPKPNGSGVHVATVYAEADAYEIAAVRVLTAALRAIVARHEGVWDDPDLVQLGGDLHTHPEVDMARIAKAALQLAKKPE